MLRNYQNFNELDKKIASKVIAEGQINFLQLVQFVNATKGRVYSRLMILAAADVIDIEYQRSNSVVVITPGRTKI